MPQDINDWRPSAPVETNTSQNLSSQIFASPQEFLQVLKDDFKDIAPKGQDMIYLTDLVSYAQQGKDEKGRAAALIAAAHYRDLEAMPDGPPSPEYDNISAPIKFADLDRDLEIASGNGKSVARKMTIEDSEMLATIGIGAVASGAVTLSFGLSFAAPGAMLGWASTSILAGWASKYGYNLTRENERAQQIVQQDIQQMNSWIAPNK